MAEKGEGTLQRSASSGGKDVCGSAHTGAGGSHQDKETDSELLEPSWEERTENHRTQPLPVSVVDCRLVIS